MSGPYEGRLEELDGERTRDLISGGDRGQVSTPSRRRARKGDEPWRSGAAATPGDGASPARRRPLGLADAADYLNVSERYMRRLVAERRIAYLKLGRLLRFSEADLDAYLEACRVTPPLPRRAQRRDRACS